MYTMSRESRRTRVDIGNVDSTRKAEIVLDLVMSYLPIKDCVRTSILSSEWRYRWTTIPSLVIDTTCCPSSWLIFDEKRCRTLADIVNRVLSQHIDSLRAFEFKGPCFAPDVDCWIFRLSKYPIEALSLKLRPGNDLYTPPSSLFSCKSLRSLELSRCLLRSSSSIKGLRNLKCLSLKYVSFSNDALEKLISSCPLLEKLVLKVYDAFGVVRYQLPPSLFACTNLSSLKLGGCVLGTSSSFTGFKNLKCLELGFLELTDNTFEKLISSCPLLEKLTLEEIMEVDSLKINAPNLQYIRIIGIYNSINFGCVMTGLTVMYVDAPDCAYDSLLDSLINFPNIQQLQLRNCHMGLEHMFLDDILEGIPFECDDVYRLAISMTFSFSECDGAGLYLYRGPYSLTRQKIWDLEGFYIAIELGVWEDDNSECHFGFEKLRSVKIDRFCALQPELTFAEFVLENSPVLEEMTVSPCSDNITWSDMKRIYGYKRASTKARIIFEA